MLILLYADRHGDLRVVLTMRARTLSSYAGQAALPGGEFVKLLSVVGAVPSDSYIQERQIP